MRYSALLGKAMRNAPPGVSSDSYSLLLKGGYLRESAPGLFSYLPLGLRVLEKLKALIRKHLEPMEAQEILVPLVSPLDPWVRSGRLRGLEKDVIRFQDRSGEELILAPAHEETLVELIRTSLSNYQELPLFVFQFQLKFRDEENPRDGLIQAREFFMKDGYSFHKSDTDLNNFFPRVFRAYERIFESCGVPFLPSESSSDYLGKGSKAFDFLMPTYNGDVTAIVCTECGYIANQDIAVGEKETFPENPRDISTVKAQLVSQALSKAGEPPRRELRLEYFWGQEGAVVVACRGDYRVSKVKLGRKLAERLTPGIPRKVWSAAGLTEGWLDPRQIPTGWRFLVDDAAANSSNLWATSSKKGTILRDLNFGRDYESSLVADLSEIQQKDCCLYCGAVLNEVKAMELGRLVKMESLFTKPLGLQYTNSRGDTIHPLMGAYEIGLGRLLAAIVEANHDERGIRWPHALAPFRFYLFIAGDSPKLKALAEELHQHFSGYCLFDDRPDSPGSKNHEADLLGIPLKVVLHRYDYGGGKAEFSCRVTQKNWLVPLENVMSHIEDYFSKKEWCE